MKLCINKFSAFVIRSYKKSRKILASIWHELKHIIQGFRSFKNDIQESVSDTKDLHYAKYKKVTYSHSRKMQNITRDVIKFIPFSIFIIIPGLELLLPAWLVIFPNAIPSQFQSSSARQKKLEQLIENRNYAAEKLLFKYPKYMKRLAKSPHLNDQEIKEMDELLRLTDISSQSKSNQRAKDIMFTILLRYKHLFTKYADFKHFRPSTLHQMAQFMGLNPITGLNTINNLLSFFGAKIDIENPYVKWFTKIILRRELKLFFRKIRREDSYLSMEAVNSFPESKLDSILIERGIEITNRTKEQKLKDYKMWQAISNLNNVPDTLLIYCRLLEFAEDLYKTNHIENEEDCVEEISHNYLHRKQVLHEFLGIDKVNDYLKHLVNIRNTFQARQEYLDSEHEKDQEKVEQLEYNLPQSINTEDYNLFQLYKESKSAVDEYKNRHHTIIGEIDKLTHENNKLLEELERIVILGFLDRKEQHILSEKYSELYEDFKNKNSESKINLEKDDLYQTTKDEIDKFKNLLELSDDLNVSSDIERELKKYSSKRNNFIE